MSRLALNNVRRTSFCRSSQTECVQEYGFELALAAHLETEQEGIISRQLGTAVSGRRIMDLVCVRPGPAFNKRVQLTGKAIPPAAIESDIGPGRFRFIRDGFDGNPDQARAVVERATECGFFETERRHGRTYARQTIRYPDWFDQLVGIENKPDLGSPGDLETQLLSDVALGLLDAVVLATESYVTRAHKNRIPEEVGIWRFDPQTGERAVIREPTQLPTNEGGVDIIERSSTRTEIRIVSPAEKQRTRRRVAERAYGKGWRTYEFPGCEQLDPNDGSLPKIQREAGLPYCRWHERIVHPTSDCDSECPGYRDDNLPERSCASLREAKTAWVKEPAGRQRTQSGLDQFID